MMLEQSRGRWLGCVALALLVSCAAVDGTPTAQGFVKDLEAQETHFRLHHHAARDLSHLRQDIRWSHTGTPVAQRAARSPLPAATKVGTAGPVTLGGLTKRAHNVGSGPVVLKNKRTIQITKFTYDGSGPDVYFLVGKGPKVTHTGATKVPTASGEVKLTKGYTGEDITLTLPGSLTFNDVDWLSVYCIRYQENFGDVRIPKNLNLPSV
ncbi:protein Skeletor, isoforms B/C [Ixodes scapularis]|nr:protein Skeletor, isoforms B/C [Ixodes scapularis]